MKGIFLVLLGVLGLFAAWKMITLSRKGGAKEVKPLPQINNEYREQNSWANSIKLPQGSAGENAGLPEKENSGGFVVGAVVGHALGSAFEPSSDGNMPSMGGAE